MAAKEQTEGPGREPRCGVIESLRGPGEPGDGFLVMLNGVVRSVVSRKNFPAPNPPGRWDDDSYADVAFDFVAAKWPRILDAALNAAVDAEFGSWLRKSFGRFLADRAEETPSGKLHRRVQRLLDDDHRFERVPPDSWALEDAAKGPRWNDSERPLVEAAWQVETTSYSWWSANGDHAAFGDRGDIVDVAAAVLRAARGPVPMTVLREVIAQRLNLPTAWRFEYQDQTHDQAAGAEGISEDDRDAASWLLSQLTAQERTLLTLVAQGRTVREAAAQLNMPRSTANALQLRAEKRAERLARLHPDPDRVVRAAARMLEDSGQTVEAERSYRTQGGDHERN